MTPAVNDCTHNCLFCWRVRGFESTVTKWQDPETVLDTCIEGQRQLVTGFKGDPRCSPAMWEEARNPRQVAISLAGEPTIYPYLGDFIELCHRRGMTTFLVTNGTFPKVLEQLSELPTQLYVTVAAPNQDIYRKLCVPRIDDGWERLMETLELLPSLNTRTVIRHTLVKDWNLGWEKDYAALDRIADPTFVEPKGFRLRGRFPAPDVHGQHAVARRGAGVRAAGGRRARDVPAPREIGQPGGRLRCGWNGHQDTRSGSERMSLQEPQDLGAAAVGRYDVAGSGTHISSEPSMCSASSRAKCGATIMSSSPWMMSVGAFILSRCPWLSKRSRASF